MKDEKIKNLISLVCNLAIVIFTAIAISKFFISSGDANMQVSGFTSLRYFTNLSNILEAAAALVMLVWNIKNIKRGSCCVGRAAYIFKFVATISVTVTFLTCVFFLGPVQIFMFAPFGVKPLAAYLSLFKGNVFFLHFLNPLLAIFSTLFLERTEGFGKKDALLGMLSTVLYSVVYVIMVIVVKAENGGWPDFYHFTFGGKLYMGAISAVCMYAATWLLCRAEYLIYSKRNKNC